MAYLLTKTAHLVFVMAWMGGVFYLPRILVNIAEAGDEPAVRARLVLMGRRLYRFGHVMFGLAFLLGLALWLHFGIGGGWQTCARPGASCAAAARAGRPRASAGRPIRRNLPLHA